MSVAPHVIAAGRNGRRVLTARVRMMAMKTNIEKTRASRMPAERPTLSTINSTRLQVEEVQNEVSTQ